MSKLLKVREVITVKGWIDGSGWSYQETHADQIINIGTEQLNQPMDWSWWETDEVEQTEGEDTKIIVRYYNPDDDPDEAEPIAEFETWESDLIKERNQ